MNMQGQAVVETQLYLQCCQKVHSRIRLKCIKKIQWLQAGLRVNVHTNNSPGAPLCLESHCNNTHGKVLLFL